VDCLYGYGVVRPDHGALINISATTAAAEMGFDPATGGSWPQEYQQPVAADTGKHGKK
jgi:hypothetical protein